MLAHLLRLGTDPAKHEEYLTLLIKYLEGRRKFLETNYWSGEATRTGDDVVFPNIGEAKTNLDFTQTLERWMNPQIDGAAYSAKAILLISQFLWPRWEKVF